MQLEHKLQSMHLAGVDIGSMNHSTEFIRGFVDNMTTVMDRRIADHVRAVDAIKVGSEYSRSWQTRSRSCTGQGTQLLL